VCCLTRGVEGSDIDGTRAPNHGEGPSLAEAWEWDEATWRQYVARIRAGSRLQPAWPCQARVAVALSFDADHETIPLRDRETSPGRLAQGEYGSRVGSGRISGVLAKFGVRASFFVPAVSAQLHPDEVRGYVEAGHEVALHGWIHERNATLPANVELELAWRSLEVLERVTGVRPCGMRTASWDFSPNTLSVIRELGLVYDSSLMADDDPYEILENGAPTGVIEIPVEWIRDDAVYFPMERFGSLRPYTSPQAVLNIWKAEFDQAYEEAGLFQLTLHPHVIGHRSRIGILEELLAYIFGRSDVWFATHAEVARHAREAEGLVR
jgi:peptidoglycan/xylan/chitin deacetylase (PgdA/CDA1 family)